jgi:hypothetical protein
MKSPPYVFAAVWSRGAGVRVRIAFVSGAFDCKAVRAEPGKRPEPDLEPAARMLPRNIASTHGRAPGPTISMHSLPGPSPTNSATPTARSIGPGSFPPQVRARVAIRAAKSARGSMEQAAPSSSSPAPPIISGVQRSKLPRSYRACDGTPLNRPLAITLDGGETGTANVRLVRLQRDKLPKCTVSTAHATSCAPMQHRTIASITGCRPQAPHPDLGVTSCRNLPMF